MESVSFLTDGAGSTSSATVQSGASTLSPFRSLDVDHRINGTPGAISNGSFRSRLGGPSRGRVSLVSVSRPVDPLDPPAEPLQPAPPDRTIFPPGSRPAVLAQARPAVKKSVALRDAPARRASRSEARTQAPSFGLDPRYGLRQSKPPGHPLRRRSRHEEPGACYFTHGPWPGVPHGGSLCHRTTGKLQRAGRAALAAANAP
jgi:hypothetical protein